MAHSIVQPSDIDDAVGMLQQATRRLDSAEQRRLFDVDRQRRSYEEGGRRAAWTWQAIDEHGRPLGFLAGEGTSDVCWVLDIMDLPPDRPEVAEALVRAAAEALRGQDPPLEIAVSCPPSDDPRTLPEMIPIDRAVRAAGFEHLVDRVRYEVTPHQRPLRLPTTKRLVPADGPDDPRLLPLMNRIVEDSLDVHHVHLLSSVSPEEAAEAELAFMIEAEGPDSLYLALDAEDDVVGLVQHAVWPDGRGCLAFLGVPRERRGRGIAGRLTSLATHALLEQGCPVVLGDTDLDNTPMRGAFESVGFVATECRVDYVWSGP